MSDDVRLCAHHARVLWGLRTAHGSQEGWLRRVRQIAAQCPSCVERAR